MSNPTVTVFTLPSCHQCDQTKTALTAQGTPFTVVDISRDDSGYDTVTELGYAAAPVVLVETDGERAHWSGFKPACIAELV